MRVTSAVAPKGKNGVDGTNGTNGTNGKSAYELAVSGGFSGTQAQWLASLKGDSGTNGTNGTNATITTTATQSANGLMSSTDKKKIDGLLRRILTTDANGLVTWTFNPPFAAGVVPVVEVTPQSSNATLSINHRITALTNTSVTVQLSASAAVTVLGVSVLGVQQPGVLSVHMTAGDPTAA